jgi:hypothetical protein
VTFLVKDTTYPPVVLYELTGVQLSVQLAGGVYTVVKGVRLQLELQKDVSGRPCPAGAPMISPIPDMLWTVVHGT